MISIFDHRPYPWPVKPMVLALLGLNPATATREQYETAWEKARSHHFGKKSPKQSFMDSVFERMKAADLDYNEAWKSIKRESPTLFLVAFPDLVEREARDLAEREAARDKNPQQPTAGRTYKTRKKTK